MLTELQENLEAILDEKNTKILPENIKSGVTIFNVAGTVTAANEEPSRDVTITSTSQTFTPASGYTGMSEINVTGVSASVDSNIQAGNIKKDVEILGITGTLEEGIDTSDANAVAGDIFTDKTAYVDGVKVTGTNTWTNTLAGGTLTELEALAENILGTGPEIVPFATATDEQISALLTAHYEGQIDLSEIWNVGDTRVIHLDAMAAPVAGSNKAHVAQDMTFRIIGFNHDTLATSINGITKAAVTIECKEVLGNYGTVENDYLSGSSDGSVYENPVYFDNAYRRTWLNTNFVNALPSTFNTLIKTVVKRNLQGHNNTTSYVETNDKAFLLSYPEVFNSTYSYYRSGAALNDIEGTQYSYYNQNNTNTGRVKYANSNGTASSTAYPYWLRSPSSIGSNDWCDVNSDGSADYYNCDNTLGLAPALSI